MKLDLHTSFYDFIERFPDSDACIRHMACVKIGQEPVCPYCERDTLFQTSYDVRKLYCRTCRKYIAHRSRTLMWRSHVCAWKWFYLLLLLANHSSGLSIDHLSRHLGVSRTAAVRMLSRARLHMREAFPMRRMGGPGEVVQIDETWLPNVYDSRQKNGKGAIIFGIHDKSGVCTWVVPDRKNSTLVELIDKWVDADSILVTDCHRSYHSLSQNGFNHIRLNHKRGEWVRGVYSMAWIESYWTSLKYFVRSRNRTVKEANLRLYLAEHAFRHNAQIEGVYPFERLISSFPDIDSPQLPRI